MYAIRNLKFNQALKINIDFKDNSNNLNALGRMEHKVYFGGIPKNVLTFALKQNRTGAILK